MDSWQEAALLMRVSVCDEVDHVWPDAERIQQDAAFSPRAISRQPPPLRFEPVEQIEQYRLEPSDPVPELAVEIEMPHAPSNFIGQQLSNSVAVPGRCRVHNEQAQR